MPDNFLTTQIEDDLLAAVMVHSPFAPLDTAISYQKLRSFDRLLSAIGEAKSQKKALSTVVSEMIGG